MILFDTRLALYVETTWACNKIKPRVLSIDGSIFLCCTSFQDIISKDRLTWKLLIISYNFGQNFKWTFDYVCVWIWTGLFLCSVLHHPVKIGNTCTCAQICPAHEMKSHPSMHAPNKIVQKQIENLHETWSITPYKPEFNPYLWEIYCSLSKIVKDCECLKQNNSRTVIIFQSLQTRHQ